MKSLLYSKIWSNFVYLSMLVLLFSWVSTRFFAYDLLELKIYYSILLIGKISAIIVMISATPLIIQIFVNTPHKDYEDGGELESWYDERVQRLGVEWCKEFIENVSDLIESNVFRFLSPTANKGVFEKAMFLHIAQRHHVNFFVSDLASIDNHEENITINNSTYTYFSETDAENIGSIINDKVNVIYDIKGVLWYSRGKNREKLIKLFYDNLLQNGILIIDDSKSKSMSRLVLYYILSTLSQIAYFWGRFLKIKVSTRYEVSTGHKMIFSRKILLNYFKPLGSITVATKNQKSLVFSVYRKIME